MAMMTAALDAIAASCIAHAHIEAITEAATRQWAAEHPADWGARWKRGTWAGRCWRCRIR